MYKKALALIPAVAATLWIAGTAEQKYTEPTLITGAAYLPEVTAAVVETIEAAEITAAPEVTAAPETIAIPEPVIVPETIFVPETISVPETTAVPETTSAPVTADAPETTSAAELQDNVVYWVKNGEVWHISVNCSSLSRSKSILSGTVEAAMDAGKERVCKRCGS
ncbi:MAG: hypothetical protein J6C52_10800 [Clostridia bacterium]|nr:hypothetical protein [Clostridia bacterium]